MKHNLLLIHKIKITRIINAIFFYLQKLPILGKHIPNSYFKLTVLKDIAGIFFIIYKCIAFFVSTLFYIAIYSILPAIFLQEHIALDFSILFPIFYFLCFIAPIPIYQSKIIKSSLLFDLYYHTFHMNPKTIMWETSLFQNIVRFFYHLIILLGCAMFTSLPYYLSFVLAILHFASRFVYDEILIRYLSTHHSFLSHKTGIHLYVVGSISICIAIIFLQPNIYTSITVSILFWLSSILLIMRSYFSFRYLHTKVNYYHIAYYLENASSIVFEKYQSYTEDKYTVSQIEPTTMPTSSKQHLYFLNDLFFKRHTKLIYKPLMFRIKLCSCLFLVCFIYCMFFSNKIEISILRFIPMFFLPLYYLNISESVNYAFFHNCDKYLLHYQTYRQKNMILKNFFIRLLYLLKYNLIFTIILCIYASILIYLIEITPTLSNYLYLWGSLFIFSIFFTINGLFLYYMFQPYSMDEEIKSPLYFIVNAVIAIIAFQLLDVKGSFQFCMILLGITILYCILAMVFVYRYAPKNFRIK